MITDCLILVGASTRAAAFSAVRAGLRPICADLFADVDLAECCVVTRIPGGEYPDELESAVRAAPPGPWAYVGALENHPELIGRVAAQRSLWGNGPDVLRRVRDPFQVADCLTRAGLPCPQVQRSVDGLQPGGKWLVKPLAGAGGRGIRKFSTNYSPLITHLSPDRFLQERIDGLSCSAVFVAASRHAALLGMTRQLVGEPGLHAKPFHYCGSIGPLPLDQALRENVSRLGQILAAEFDLVGLFGVDGILADGVFWPVEINPRHTASVEVLELMLGVPMMALHRDACTGQTTRVSERSNEFASRGTGRTLLGKAILFARDELVITDLSACLRDPIDCSGRWPVPRIADVPRAGEHFTAGQPICTVFAVRHSVEACRQALLEAAQRIYCQPAS